MTTMKYQVGGCVKVPVPGGAQQIAPRRKCARGFRDRAAAVMPHNKFQHNSAATVTYLYLTITYVRTMELYSPVGYGATVQRETVKL